MNSKLIKILLAICLVLVVILLAEWTYANYSNKELLRSMDNIEQQPYVENKLPKIDLSVVPIEYYTEMVVRPLFIQGRKPVVEDQVEAVESLDLGDIDDWLLVGIYSNHKQLFALFKSLEKEKKHSKKQQGDDISGWKIKEILADKVIVVRAGKEQSILLRKPKTTVKLKSKARRKPRPKLQPKPRRKPNMVGRQQKKITPEK